jgi:hypothetical protein
VASRRERRRAAFRKQVEATLSEVKEAPAEPRILPSSRHYENFRTDDPCDCFWHVAARAARERHPALETLPDERCEPPPRSTSSEDAERAVRQRQLGIRKPESQR